MYYLFIYLFILYFSWGSSWSRTLCAWLYRWTTGIIGKLINPTVQYHLWAQENGAGGQVLQWNWKVYNHTKDLMVMHILNSCPVRTQTMGPHTSVDLPLKT